MLARAGGNLTVIDYVKICTLTPFFRSGMFGGAERRLGKAFDGKDVSQFLIISVSFDFKFKKCCGP